MNSEAVLEFPAAAVSPAPAEPRRRWPRAEDVTLTLALGAMIALPMAEVFLRFTLHRGLAGSAAWVQHLTLIAGMIGGAVAARDGRLLSLSTATTFLKGRWKAAAIFLGGAAGAGVTAWLCVASAQFVLQEKAAGNLIAYGIPRWTVQIILPLGFAVIALRMVWNAAQTSRGRASAALVVAGLALLGTVAHITPAKLVLPALLGLAAATLAGTPVFVTLGGAALVLFWGREVPATAVAIEHYGLVTNPTLPTIPLFTLAGYFLAEGGASKRLVRVFQALVGWFRGGPALATALACAFFTSFTGASGVTILALGGLLMPVLLAARYSERNALGLLTGAGSLGLLLPPCLPLILYAVVAKVDMKDTFLGGILPGILLVTLTAAWGIWQAPKGEGERRAFDLTELRHALWDAKWELALPAVALFALFGGIATPVEAAALTAFYAFFVETVVYRDLKILRDVPRVMTECGLLVGGILLILGVALGFTNYLIDAQLPDRAVAWVGATIHSRWVFLLALNFLLLVVGCLMDIFSAIIVVVPILVPMGAVFGVDPIHLGIIFLANLELGYLTPPVGMNLFLSSYRFNKPMAEVTRSVLPMLVVLFIGVLLITYVPPLTTVLPQLFKIDKLP